MEVNTSSRKRFFSDPQNIIAIGVTVISLCALIVSSIQTQVFIEEQELMREFHRASVWPQISLGLTKGHDKNDRSINTFSLNLSNNGVGPAIITDVKVTYNDSVARSWWNLFDIQEMPDSIEKYITNRRFNNQIIKIGETIEILNLDNNLPLANAFFKKLDGVHIEIYYESIYGEKWKYDVESTTELENFAGLPDEEQFW